MNSYLVILFLISLYTFYNQAFAIINSNEHSSPQSHKIINNIQKSTKTYLMYNKTIHLSAKQEKIFKEALKPIPAPCCDNYSAATCCCPCNLSKSIWGLSKHLIKDLNYNALKVRESVQAWMKRINPKGYSGNACYRPNGCNSNFKNDGCGGMQEANLNTGY